MANFEPKKLTRENINKGQRYQNGDGVDAEAINAPIESALWVQNLAVGQPNVIVDSSATTISVTIQNSDNQPYFQFTFPEFITERKLRDRSIELIDTKEVFAETFSFNAGTTVTYLYADPNDSDDYELYLPPENGTLATREWTEENLAPKGYRLIETITLTEDTRIITRTQEPNGKVYNFSEVFIRIAAQKASASGVIRINLDRRYVGNINNGLRVDYTAYSTVKAWIDESIRLIFTEFSQNGNQFANPSTTLARNGGVEMNHETIQSVKIWNNTNEPIIPAGTVIEIYAKDV